MPDLKIQLIDDAYRLVIDGTPTESAAYGESLECNYNGHKYLCLLDIGDKAGDTVESVLDSWVYVDGQGIDDVPMEDVDDFEGDGEVDGDGEGDEDGDEPETGDPDTTDDPDHNITQT